MLEVWKEKKLEAMKVVWADEMARIEQDTCKVVT